MSSGGKGGGGGSYYKYHLSLHAGIAFKLDSVSSIILGDREIWSGHINRSWVLNVHDDELFGGPSREGGVNGGITFLMGEDHQHMPPYLLSKFGDLADRIPSYRGMTSIFFHERVIQQFDNQPMAELYDYGQDQVFDIADVQTPSSGIFGSLASVLEKGKAALTGRAGFYMQANNPYLRDLKVIGSRTAKGLSRTYGTIWRDSAQTVSDANPAHIIYELQTSRDFGAGLSISRIDVESFELAARTLYNEGFGLTMKWVSQGQVKTMILEVLDHINGLVFEDPRTGLVTLKLLRGDYDIESLPTADRTNCSVLSFQRKTEELVNEVTITFTNGQTYEDSTVTVQDLAGIAAEGGVVSTSRNYYGVHKPALAKNLGERALRSEGYPLATAEVEFFRKFWDLRPGSVLKLDSPEDSDSLMIMRVMRVEDDATSDKPVKAQLVEDVFALTEPGIAVVPETLFVDPDTPAEAASHIQALTLPYTFAVRAGLRQPEVDDYPTSHLGVMAATNQSGADFYDIAGTVTGALGSTSLNVLTRNTIIARGTLPSALVAEVESTVLPLSGISRGNPPEIESLLVIGSGTDSEMELAGVYKKTDTTLELRRGILDTVPRDWPIGTPVWVINPTSSAFWDSTDRAAFEDTEYKVLPVTTTGTYSIDDAALRFFTLSERPHLPFRPADIQVEGTAFGTHVSADRLGKEVTWSNRLRFGEDAVILAWDDISVTPEDGQTVEIDVLSSTRVVLHSHVGLTGTSFTIPPTSWAGQTEVIIQVWASREGYRSLQAHEVTVQLPEAEGYGNNYGSSYGA